VSEWASVHTLALPFHARLPLDDQEYVVDSLRAVLG
jgi:dTDP-4-amino-4,6-dideoxygalactose transaminase